MDVKRAAVVGRSYGGYMTLTLAGCDPELWAAACDMFGPYDLLTFSARIPETWKPYFKTGAGRSGEAGGKGFPGRAFAENASAQYDCADARYPGTKRSAGGCRRIGGSGPGA